MVRIYNKAFKIGVVTGLAGFIAMNLYSAFKGPEHGFKICFDCYEVYGFPFVMHEYGTIAHLDQFVWSGVVANAAAAFVASVLLGYLVSCVSRLVENRKFR